MLKKSSKLLFISFLCVVYACANNASQESQIPTSTQSYDWLTGRWMAHGMEYYETWEIVDDSTMSATVENDEDGITEKILLTYRKGQWIYTPTYLSAKRGTAIDFTAVEATPHMIQFENRQNDFPNRIVYFHTSDEQIDVKIENLDGQNVVQSYDILMSRIK